MCWILKTEETAKVLPYVSKIEIFSDGCHVKFTEDVGKAVPFDDWGTAFYLSGKVPIFLEAIERN